jgi:hypothetical protein
MSDTKRATRGGVRPGAGRRHVDPAGPLVYVGTRVPVHQFDRLVKLANLREESVSALVRQLLVLRLDR